jgi:hypothetical protein
MFEFVKTEVNYVKILTITQKVYVNVMLNEYKVDIRLLRQMFPDLDKLIDLHHTLLARLMERYKIANNKQITSISDILLDIVNWQIN